MTPTPKPLPLALENDEAAVTLAKMYIGAVDQLFPDPKRFHALLQNLRQSKHFKALLAAVAVFQEWRIPPHEWIFFSMHCWRLQRSGAASVAYTFSAKRLAERRDWFDDWRMTQGGYQAMCASEQQVALTARFVVFERDIRLSQPKTSQEVIAVVDRHFPGDSYERLEAAAVSGNRWVQRAVDTMIANGGCPWVL